MSENKYQVFISYRYVDYDGFVADELHKALLDFKVPRSLRKKLANPDEYRIERLFQDKIKLSVTGGLWDAIEEALLNTEYLVVICSPRVQKDSWCYKEIETFIKKNGPDKVIAVLAEGEPEDVIPDIMRINGGLPYAADVRGASKKEVKKRIKEAIPRIVAPIFGLQYEQLRNRFQEERWNHKIRLMAGISAVVVVAGVFSMAQMFEAQHQKRIQEKQLIELEKQMKENLFQQEKIFTLLAENEMNEGNWDVAIDNLLRGLPDNISDPEYPIYNQACFDLSKALRVYENGESYSKFKKPFTDPETGALIVASHTKQIDDYRMLLACDSVGMGYIWNVNEGKADFKFPLAYYNDEIDTDDKYNYFFDSAGDKNIAIEDNVMYISDAVCMRAISLENYDTLWEIRNDYTMALDVYDDVVVACNVGDVMVINAKTGAVIASKNDFNDEFGNQNFKHALLSKDKKSIIIRAMYDTELEYALEFAENPEEKAYEESKIKAHLYRVSIDDLSLIEKKQIGGIGTDSYWIDPNRELLYVLEYVDNSDSVDMQGQDSALMKVCAYDLENLSERWSVNSDRFIGQAYFFDKPKTKDNVYFVASNVIIEVSKEDGQYVYSSEFSSDIINLVQNELSGDNAAEKDYRFEGLCIDGKVMIQMDLTLSFVPKGMDELTETDGLFYRFGKKYVLPYITDSYYYVIDKLESPYGTEISYEMIPEIDRSAVQSFSYSDFDSEQFGVSIAPNANNDGVDIKKDGITVYTYPCVMNNISEMLVTADSRFVFLMFGQGDTVLIHIENDNVTDEDAIVIGDIDVKMTFRTNKPDEWIVMTDKYGNSEYSVYTYDSANKTFEKLLMLKEFETYDSVENMIYEYCDSGCVKIPLYSVEELVELAKQYRNK